MGQSKNLRVRVKSYFRSQKHTPKKTSLIVSKIVSVDLFRTESPFEAILLEARLIRRLLPKYNSRLRDDRSPLYIAITDEEYPRVLLRRKTEIGELQGTLRPRVQGREASGKLQVFGPFLSARQTRKILQVARRVFLFCDKKRKNGRACFYAHIGLCSGACTGAVSVRSYRSNIRKLAQFLNGDFQLLKTRLTREMGGAARRQNYELAREKRNIVNALDNLKLATRQDQVYPLNKKRSLKSLADLLGLARIVRVEGYDVSNLGLRQAAASMVVFIDGAPDPSEYRHFRILRTTGDAAMIAEALRRRLTHAEWDSPDLVVIDGGEPQLRTIQKEFSVKTRLRGAIPFIGLAKEPDRIVVPEGNSFRRHFLPSSDNGLQLLMAVRDEAHRFARRYHRLLREKALLG